MVLWHLYAILMFVFLNMFVTLRICGEIYVNVAHFLFLVWCVLFYVQSDVLVYVLLCVGNCFVGRCEGLLNILFEDLKRSYYICVFTFWMSCI